MTRAASTPAHGYTRMLIGMDATPLLGQRSGVGRYVHGLLGALGDHPDRPEVLLTLFSIRGEVPGALPPGARPAPRRAPARLLRRAWARLHWPPVELLTGRVDVFHGTNFVLPPRARAGGIVTVHDLAYLRYAETVTGDAAEYATLVPAALRRGAHVLAVSQSMAEEIADQYALPPDRVHVARHGVDPSWSGARPLGSPERAARSIPERYFVVAGNLEPRKNLGMLVRAHRAARRAHPDVPPLVLVGPAGWGDRWQGSPPDPADVVVVGYLPDDELRAVVAGAEALCMPSSYEGFGLPVLEALAAGRPVLASDIAAHREVSGGFATLLPPDDPDAWSAALLPDVVHDGDTDRSARREHAAQFTWAASAAAHVEAYARVAADRGPRGPRRPRRPGWRTRPHLDCPT